MKKMNTSAEERKGKSTLRIKLYEEIMNIQQAEAWKGIKHF